MRKQPTKNSLKLMVQHAKMAEGMLKQLANARRLMILCRLVEGEETVLNLAAQVGLSQSALSQHLIKLKSEGLVSSEKRGQKVFYKISEPSVQKILAVLHSIYC